MHIYSMGSTTIWKGKMIMNDTLLHLVWKKACSSVILPSLNGERTFNLCNTFFFQESVTLCIFSSSWKSISNVIFFFFWDLSCCMHWYQHISGFLFGPVGEFLSFTFLLIKPVRFFKSSYLSTCYSLSLVLIFILSYC